MRGFRSGQITVLVATDVVGRGIDVEGISHVINYDMPDDAENYVHRIGRTGRMGKDGVAYLFVCPDQGEPLTAIENLTNRVIPPLQHRGIQPSPAEDRDRGPRDVQQYDQIAITQPRAFSRRLVGARDGLSRSSGPPESARSAVTGRRALLSPNPAVRILTSHSARMCSQFVSVPFRGAAPRGHAGARS